MFSLICVVGFIAFQLLFLLVDYKTSYNWMDKNEVSAEFEYTMPALIGPHEGELITKGAFEPIFEVPAIINAKKLNTVIWSIATGIVLYGLIRLFLENGLVLY